MKSNLPRWMTIGIGIVVILCLMLITRYLDRRKDAEAETIMPCESHLYLIEDSNIVFGLASCIPQEGFQSFEVLHWPQKEEVRKKLEEEISSLYDVQFIAATEIPCAITQDQYQQFVGYCQIQVTYERR